MANNFYDNQKRTQIHWRESNISSKEFGRQNGKTYPHIVPKPYWKETLWHPLRESLPIYLAENRIQAHTGTHNLLSSWVSAANLYFMIRFDEGFKLLMLSFLQKNVSHEITDIIQTELEFSLPGALSPEQLLGEMGGSRGSGQTSPDVAFVVQTKQGKGIILTECKYTEHSFYRCSARRTNKESESKPPNPDPSRCMQLPSEVDYPSICHQMVWERKYWQHLTLSENAHTTLNRCPATTAGYQLFRQHALAEGIAKSGEYDLVASTVAYDGRNDTLIGSLKSTGIPNFSTGWGSLFNGEALFTTWTHQMWVNHVQEENTTPLQKEWVQYMEDRYGY